VLRQAALLRALSGTGVPVPRVLATWPGDSAVPPFFVTEFVTGDAYEPIFDGPGRCSEVAIRARTLHAASLLAVLHGLDARALGVVLDAPTTPADEVQRWMAAFASVPDELAGDAAQLGRALGARPPDPAQPTLTHGDYRLGNMIAEGGAVRAILDWEIWSFADPRLDLAWFVAQADASSHPLTVWQPPGMPDPEALVAAYEAARGVVVGDLSWFAALVRFKVAATSALIAKHDRSCAERDPSRSKWEPGIPVLIGDGLRILEAAR
jgi:aminoglycoside phosphotransferase (APT) family kinase protein